MEKYEAKLVDYLFENQQAGPRRQKRRSHALLLMKGHCVHLELYDLGFGPDNPHLLWSVSKSLSNLVIGRAVELGLLSLSDPLSLYFPESRYPFLRDLKLIHLLDWSSGVSWQETYEFSPLFSDVVAMLYTRGRRDMSKDVLGRKARAAPGEAFNYSTGDSTLLMGVLDRALKLSHRKGLRPSLPQTGRDFVQREFFDKLQINSAVWESDSKDQLVGGALAYASAPDLAKIGLFVLNQGRWNGEQLISKDWFENSFQVVDTYQGLGPARDGFPGRHWWLNRRDESKGRQKAWPDAPEDAVLAQGHWGQLLVLIPSQSLVLVRFGDELARSTDKNKVISLLSKWGAAKH